MREILNGIFYHARGGASWRMLPHDLPPWGTVHYINCTVTNYVATATTKYGTTITVTPMDPAGPCGS